MPEQTPDPLPAHRWPVVTAALVAATAIVLVVVVLLRGGLPTIHPTVPASATSTTGSPTTRSAAAPASATNANLDPAHALVGLWRGSYVCRQGETAVEISITDFDAKGAIKATFHFFNMPGQTNAAEGEFALSGQYDPALGKLTMTAGEWIKQPENYVTAGFVAYWRPPATTMAGTVDNNACRQINLTKTGS